MTKKEAIKVIDGRFEIMDYCENARLEEALDLAIKALEQPERKKGKWIYNSPVTMKCDQCGLVIKDWDWHRFKYCPNCIAEMRGEKE